MVLVDDELKVFREQLAMFEPLPFFTDFGGNAELGFTLLEKLGDFAGVAAQKAKLQAVEQALDLVEMRNQERQIDGMGQRNPQRTDFAALEGRGKFTRASRCLITLLEQRMHALAELGQLCGGPLAAKQVATEFGLQLFDGPRQRGLRDIALVGGAREVEHTRNREEVANLMHLHGRAPSVLIAP